jgi:hypothetical protein
MYTMGQAARAVGKAKSTLSRDVKAGKISAIRNPDGSLAIDPAELHRVYPPVFHQNGSGNGRSYESQPPANAAGTGFEQREIEQLRERLADKDARLADKDAAIDDLRHRLDRETEERRRLTAVLTDRRERPTADPPPVAPWPRSRLSRLLLGVREGKVFVPSILLAHRVRSRAPLTGEHARVACRSARSSQ